MTGKRVEDKSINGRFIVASSALIAHMISVLLFRNIVSRFESIEGNVEINYLDDNSSGFIEMQSISESIIIVTSEFVADDFAIIYLGINIYLLCLLLFLPLWFYLARSGQRSNLKYSAKLFFITSMSYLIFHIKVMSYLFFGSYIRMVSRAWGLLSDQIPDAFNGYGTVAFETDIPEVVIPLFLLVFLTIITAFLPWIMTRNFEIHKTIEKETHGGGDSQATKKVIFSKLKEIKLVDIITAILLIPESKLSTKVIL